MNQTLKYFTHFAVALLCFSQIMAQPNINRIEYYLDTDPGQGRATTANFSSAQNVTTQFNIETAALTSGFHVVGIRSKDANGVWSFDEHWIIIKPSAPASVSKIVKVEWYLDRDPGNGKGINIPMIADGNLTVGFDIQNLDTLTAGLHIVAIRSIDENGLWSFDERWLLVKERPVEVTPSLVRVEYFIDNDPGPGHGIPLAFQPNVKDILNLPSFVNITGLPIGIHKIGIRSLDTKGAWSFDDTLNFTIESSKPTPFINVNSVAFTNVCAAGKFTLGFHATGNFNTGNQFIAELSNSTGSFSNPTSIGAITDIQSNLINCEMPVNIQQGTGYKMRVRSTNPSVTGNGSDQSLSISVDQLFLGADTFALVLCAEDKLDLSNYYNPANSTVTWSIGTNPTAASVGVHTIYATNAIGCKDSAIIIISVKTNTWLGIISNNWHTAGNWSTGEVPDDSTHVIIPGNTPNPCVISQADAIAASVQIKTVNAILRINTGRKLLLMTNCKTLPNE